MVTRTAISPTKPKKVWKPKQAPDGGGVPSLFASATMGKPLKINATATNTVQRTSRTTNRGPTTTTTTSAAAAAASKPMSSSDAAAAKPAAIPTKKPPAKKSAASTAASKTQRVSKATTLAPNRQSSNSKTNILVGGNSTTVAGIPQSWPKPHAVPNTAKAKAGAKAKPTTRFSKPKSSQDDNDGDDIDELIPEMYRRKSAAQLEQEQQEEIQLMHKIMWELRRQEQTKVERELQATPIKQGINSTLEALRIAKQVNDDADSHSSVDSDHTPLRESAYSTHMKSKLEFFNSTHSVSLISNWGDDDSSVSSSDSDSSDGLFRGY